MNKLKNNKISIIGVGKLGLCLSLNLERSGFEIIGIDVNQNYIDSLNSKQYESSEPYVSELLKESNKIKFTTDISESIKSDIIFVVVKTPSDENWKFDHTQIEDVANELIKLGKQPVRKDLVINCTTFPGYCDSLHQRLKEYNYYVSYNPEFIAQGTIIKDQINCDTVLIGEADKIAGDLISEIYQSMVKSNPTYNRMSRTEAELTKLSVNCFLTTKISFANMIGDIAIRLNCNPETVLTAVGNDSRIGNKYLKHGYGFGGPCFPRDNRALNKCAEEVGIDAVISRATDVMNEKHLNYQVEEFIKNNPNKEEVINLDFVTYKKESTLIEESQQLKFAIKLKEMGYNIRVLDNREEVIEQLKNIL